MELLVEALLKAKKEEETPKFLPSSYCASLTNASPQVKLARNRFVKGVWKMWLLAVHSLRRKLERMVSQFIYQNLSPSGLYYQLSSRLQNPKGVA